MTHTARKKPPGLDLKYSLVPMDRRTPRREESLLKYFPKQNPICSCWWSIPDHNQVQKNIPHEDIGYPQGLDPDQPQIGNINAWNFFRNLVSLKKSQQITESRPRLDILHPDLAILHRPSVRMFFHRGSFVIYER